METRFSSSSAIPSAAPAILGAAVFHGFASPAVATSITVTQYGIRAFGGVCGGLANLKCGGCSAGAASVCFS